MVHREQGGTQQVEMTSCWKHLQVTFSWCKVWLIITLMGYITYITYITFDSVRQYDKQKHWRLEDLCCHCDSNINNNDCQLETGNNQQSAVLKSDVLLNHSSALTSSLRRLCLSVTTSPDFLHNSYSRSVTGMSAYIVLELKQLILLSFLGGQSWLETQETGGLKKRSM